MSYHQAHRLGRPQAGPAARQRQILPVPAGHRPPPPRIVRLPGDWWDSPPVVSCPLSRGSRSAATARRLTRDTLCDWNLSFLAEGAENIVGELAANAVTHGVLSSADGQPAQENIGLRLRLRTDEIICAVLDPSCPPPLLKDPGSTADSGRGLQIVDALSDVWGWSPIPGRGKAVWALLFLPAHRAEGQWMPSQDRKSRSGEVARQALSFGSAARAQVVRPISRCLDLSRLGGQETT
jgi:hypothetical protein